MTPVSLYPGAASRIPLAGVSIPAVYGPVLGGFVVNPFSAADQGLQTAEPLFLDPTGPAALFETSTTIELSPGGTWSLPANFGGTLYINAATAGHQFSSVVYQTPTNPTPTPTPNTEGFPPVGPTTLTKTIPSYLYQQYNDDDDLQAFVASFNALAQEYVSFFANVSLPVYTGLSGGLLDWVALGLYGVARPTLPSGSNRDTGSYNTYAFDTTAFNTIRRVGPQNVQATSDDTFKRCLTWALYKGDGKVFDIRWLKRRVKRFLIGVNGSAPNVDETYDISVTVGGGIVTIGITVSARRVVAGPHNTGALNTIAYNGAKTVLVPGTFHYPAEPVFASALLSGALGFPFQYRATVQT